MFTFWSSAAARFSDSQLLGLPEFCFSCTGEALREPVALGIGIGIGIGIGVFLPLACFCEDRIR
ncbi:MAG: hypothetical protein ACK5R1_00505 [Planctomycetota bacterium]